MQKWLTLALFAVLLGVAAVIAWRSYSSTYSAAESAAAPAARAANRDLPELLPDVSLPNRDGQMQSLRAWPGKSMIINFWATWCGPCRREIPLLKEIAAREGQRGFQVVGVAIDFRDAVLKFAEEVRIDYPLLIGEQNGIAAADAFGVHSVGLPFTVFTDNQGRIVTLFMGELNTERFNVLRDAVTRVNENQVTPEQARASIAEQFALLASQID